MVQAHLNFCPEYEGPSFSLGETVNTCRDFEDKNDGGTKSQSQDDLSRRNVLFWYGSSARKFLGPEYESPSF